MLHSILPLLFDQKAFVQTSYSKWVYSLFGDMAFFIIFSFITACIFSGLCFAMAIVASSIALRDN
jgi:hypothetical protein